MPQHRSILMLPQFFLDILIPFFCLSYVFHPLGYYISTPYIRHALRSRIVLFNFFLTRALKLFVT